jgi:hypothetical protein
MAGDRYDELLAAHAAHAQRQALSQINDEAQNVLRTMDEQLRRGDSSGAGWSLRSYAALKSEYDVIAGAPAQQQQAPQQPQGPQQFTQAEMEWIRANEGVVRDPKKWAECVAAANSLIARGYNRDSAEYLGAIELAIGLRGPDGQEGNEIISPNQVVEICKITPDQYREGAARLAEMKRQGFYKAE